MLSTTHTVCIEWDLISSLTLSHKRFWLSKTLTLAASSFTSRISQPLSQPLSSSLYRSRSRSLTSKICSQILSMRTTTCLGLTCTTNRMLRLHHLMGCINVFFFFCYLLFVTWFGYTVVDRTLRFECFLQKSQRRIDLYGESLFLLHPLNISFDVVHLLSLFLAITLVLSFGF